MEGEGWPRPLHKKALAVGEKKVKKETRNSPLLREEAARKHALTKVKTTTTAQTNQLFKKRDRIGGPVPATKKTVHINNHGDTQYGTAHEKEVRTGGGSGF